MPYSKQRYKKHIGAYKRSFRPGYRACGSMVLSDAQRALYKVGKLKALLNVEYKHHNIQGISTTVTDAGVITNCSLLSQGDTSQTRDGGSVKFTSLRLAYNIKINASATNTTFRVMIVHDKQTNQAQFTLADLLFDATTVDNIVSPYNVNNASRFNVLYDRLHTLSSTGSTSNVSRIIHKKLNMKTRYDAAVGDITDLTQDSISLVFIADEVTNDPGITFNYRSRFIDN